MTNDQAAVLQNIRQGGEYGLRQLQHGRYRPLLQLHVGVYPPEKASAVRAVLEDLVGEGKIRWYGWSTDNAQGARVFADGAHCTAIQQAVNWATRRDYAPTLKVCEEFDLASVMPQGRWEGGD